MKIVSSSKDNRQFSDDLLPTGNDEFQAANRKVLKILVFRCKSWKKYLRKYISILVTYYMTLIFFPGRAILSRTKDEVDQINEFISYKFEAPSQTFYSVDIGVNREFRMA